MKLYKFLFVGIWGGLIMTLSCASLSQDATWPAKTEYHYEIINGNRIFYREAGIKKNNRPTIVLLHGWPTSSHYYRELIPLLSGKYHVIAPDNLGSGYSDKPDAESTNYTFDLLADHLEGLLNSLDIKEYIFYMHDFGAPIGFRVMLRNPDKVKGIIAQNGNVYSEGVVNSRKFFIQAYEDRSEAFIERLNNASNPDNLEMGYLKSTNNKAHIISPDSWSHDRNVLESAEGRKIQTKLFQDYKNNLELYPDWQNFLNKYKPPTLIIWGGLDKTFVTAGGMAYKKDVPDAEFHVFEDAGHFALEEHPVEIAKLITHFLENL